jgi:GMP synthase-like glutamine amidotransferase
MAFRLRESTALKTDLEEVQAEYTRLIIVLGSTEGLTGPATGKLGDLVAKIQNLSNKINDLNT